MAVGQVQQVAKPAAGAVPPLIADAVLQDDVVGAEGAQQAMHVLGRPLRIDLVNLQNGAEGTALRGQPVRRLPQGSNLSPAPSHAGHPLQSASVWGKCQRNTVCQDSLGDGERAMLNPSGARPDSFELSACSPADANPMLPVPSHQGSASQTQSLPFKRGSLD